MKQRSSRRRALCLLGLVLLWLFATGGSPAGKDRSKAVSGVGSLGAEKGKEPRTFPSRRAARRAAVRRGQVWMERYVEKHWSVELGTDAILSFVELSANDDPYVRKRSLAFGKRLAERLSAYYLRDGTIEDADDLMTVIELLGYTDVLGFDVKPPLAKV